jgi:hypothetical protein
MTLSKKAYDAAKYVAQVALPALGTAYASASAIWHLPNSEAIVATIVTADTLLGVLLHLDTKSYNAQQAQVQADEEERKADGQLIVSNVDGERYLSLGIKDTTVENLASQGKVTLSVVHNNPEATAVSSEPPPMA